MIPTKITKPLSAGWQLEEQFGCSVTKLIDQVDGEKPEPYYVQNSKHTGRRRLRLQAYVQR